MKYDRKKQFQEVAERLEKEPLFIALHDKARADLALYEARMIDELKDAGFEVNSITDLEHHTIKLRRFKKNEQRAIELLLKWIPVVEHDGLKSLLVHLVGTSRKRYDGTVLANEFDLINGQLLQWMTLHAMATSNPIGLEQWLHKTSTREDLHEWTRAELLLAMAHLLPEADANQVIARWFGHSDFVAVRAARALAKIGKQAEHGFLRSQLSTCKDRQVIAAINKALSAIERRMKSQS